MADDPKDLARRFYAEVINGKNLAVIDELVDDNLVEHATAGLIAADVRVPHDLDVIAHCNFPYPPPASTPAKRLGFDARDILDVCVGSIDRQRAGESPAGTSFVRAKFDDES